MVKIRGRADTGIIIANIPIPHFQVVCERTAEVTFPLIHVLRRNGQFGTKAKKSRVLREVMSAIIISIVSTESVYPS